MDESVQNAPIPEKKLEKTRVQALLASLSKALRSKRILLISGGIVLVFLSLSSFLLLNQNAQPDRTPSPTTTQPTPTISSPLTPTSFLPRTSPTRVKSLVIPTVTSTPTAIPTSTRTTGSISGGYYDSATMTPLTDSQFAVAAQSDQSYARSDDKPTWKLNDLKPGRYVVSIDVNSGKFSQHDIKCTNCTLSNIHFGYAEVDLKAGDDIQIQWLFKPK